MSIQPAWSWVAARDAGRGKVNPLRGRRGIGKGNELDRGDDDDRGLTLVNVAVRRMLAPDQNEISEIQFLTPEQVESMHAILTGGAHAVSRRPMP